MAQTINQMKMKREMKSLEKENKLLKKENELLSVLIGAGEEDKFYEVKTENKKLKEELEELKKDNDELYTWEDVEEKADDLLTSVISDAIDDEECVIGSSGLEDYIKKLKARITELEECNDELQEEIKGLTDDIEEAEENRRFSKSILCEANKKSNKWDKLIKAIKKSHEEMNPETEEFGYLDLWEELEELGVDTRGNETE